MTYSRPMLPPVDQARRHFLTIAAAGATALTVAPARAAAPAADPIHAAIEAHRSAYAAYDQAAEAPTTRTKSHSASSTGRLSA